MNNYTKTVPLNHIGEDPNLQSLINVLRDMIRNPCEQLETRCEDMPFHVFLMGFGFIFVFTWAMFGNCINVLIYNSDQIRFYLAIRMLCTRLLINSFTMVSLLPQALRTISIWQPNSNLDHIYWAYYPYQAYFVNVFGFCSMWITVMMTGECYLHVFFPSHSKSLCTKRNLRRSYVSIFCAASILASIYPLNRKAYVTVDQCGRVIVQIVASQDSLMQAFERLHTITHLLLASVLPMGLLIYMTSRIVWKLLLRKAEFPNSTHFTSEKRCVTRITLITTFLQLLGELPSIPGFIYAALIGPHVVNDKGICIGNTIGVFLGLCNMSLSFFVYAIFSHKFRQILCRRYRQTFGCLLIGTAPNNVSKSMDYRLQTGQLTSRELLAKSPCVTDSFLLTEKSTFSTIDVDDTHL
ncbi:unnamed protein product [Auanema sp. JU1783]|nr:unnamed protein product [Auanema sp. JU1783]